MDADPLPTDERQNTLWQVGTDHAGIATQMLVERKLEAEEGKIPMTRSRCLYG